MALMFLRRRSYVKASMVLTRIDHYYIHNYIENNNKILSKYYCNGVDGA